MPVQVNVAQQIYDLVDQRILRLDRNLKSFDTELIRQRHELELAVSSCLLPGLACLSFSGAFQHPEIPSSWELCIRAHMLVKIASSRLLQTFRLYLTGHVRRTDRMLTMPMLPKPAVRYA